MAKLFVIQDRYNEEVTSWHVFSNAAKAHKKFDELDDEREEDWQLKLKEVSGPNCGFLIGFDDDMGEVFAEPVKDVSNYELGSQYGNTTAYLIGPKSKEGKLEVTSYGDLEVSGNLQQLAYWEMSELEENYKGNVLKHVKLFEQFVNEKFSEPKAAKEMEKLGYGDIQIWKGRIKVTMPRGENPFGHTTSYTYQWNGSDVSAEGSNMAYLRYTKPVKSAKEFDNAIKTADGWEGSALLKK